MNCLQHFETFGLLTGNLAAFIYHSGFHFFTVYSCGKVMFLHLSVILFTRGCLADTPWQADPPWADTHWSRHPPGRHPQADTSGRHFRQTPPQDTATAADSMHSTGMHSCFIFMHFLAKLNDRFARTPGKKILDPPLLGGGLTRNFTLMCPQRNEGCGC